MGFFFGPKLAKFGIEVGVFGAEKHDGHNTKVIKCEMSGETGKIAEKNVKVAEMNV